MGRTILPAVTAETWHAADRFAGRTVGYEDELRAEGGRDGTIPSIWYSIDSERFERRYNAACRAGGTTTAYFRGITYGRQTDVAV